MKFLSRYKYKILTGLLIALLTVIMAGCKKQPQSNTVTAPINSQESSTTLAQDGNGQHEVEWMIDFEQAKLKAQAENKDLLLNFAGSDWCYWCKKLDKEVFSKSEFLDAVQNDFVLVLIDFPNDKSGQSKATQRQNEKLAGNWGVRGFPSIFLADAMGKPYAQTGYQEGGARVYLDHLKELQQKKPAL